MWWLSSFRWSWSKLTRDQTMCSHSLSAFAEHFRTSEVSFAVCYVSLQKHCMQLMADDTSNINYIIMCWNIPECFCYCAELQYHLGTRAVDLQCYCYTMLQILCQIINFVSSQHQYVYGVKPASVHCDHNQLNLTSLLFKVLHVDFAITICMRS